MNIRQAILAAADHIERNPEQYDFNGLTVPEPGCQACMLGFVGMFLGMSGATNNDVKRALNPEHVHGFYEILEGLLGNCSYVDSAGSAATALRRYADKYFPAAEPAYPNWQAIANGPDKVKDSARDQALDWVRA